MTAPYPATALEPELTTPLILNFIREAANDPNVLAIKICLYRTGQQSEVAEILRQAGEQGKQVTALIELKARGVVDGKAHGWR